MDNGPEISKVLLPALSTFTPHQGEVARLSGADLFSKTEEALQFVLNPTFFFNQPGSCQLSLGYTAVPGFGGVTRVSSLDVYTGLEPPRAFFGDLGRYSMRP
jgi:hypothetical protein